MTSPNMVTACPDTGLPCIEVAGEVRRLGTLPHVGPRVFAGSVPDVPVSEWRPLDRRAFLNWIQDQKSHGSCNGYAGAGALSRARRLRGLARRLLSGAFLYSLINGGRDQGSGISEGLVALQKVGTCPEEMAGWDQIYPNRYDSAARAAASRFRIEDAYVPKSYRDIISGLQLDYVAVFAVCVGNSFSRVGADGVAGYDRGTGNHAVHGDGCRQLGSDWVIDMVNSWSPRFGQDGRCYLTERHIDGIGYQDIYMIQAALEDPEEPNPVPVVLA